MYSDASFEGFGAWLGKDWLFGTWNKGALPPIDPGCSHIEDPPATPISRNINVCELWPNVVGLRRWGQHFACSRLHLITDNMQVLAMINTGRSSNSVCMTWLREIFWMCFIWNLDVWASYIKSADNVLADALSRLPYSGVPRKCLDLLSTLNMCCSSPCRNPVGQSTPPSEEFPECCPGSHNQEVPPMPDQLLL